MISQAKSEDAENGKKGEEACATRKQKVRLQQEEQGRMKTHAKKRINMYGEKE